MTRHRTPAAAHRPGQHPAASHRGRSFADLSAALRSWWARRCGAPPPLAPAPADTCPEGAGPPARAAESATAAGYPGGTGDGGTAGGGRDARPSTLWRMRTTVDDVPGSLAGLCVALAVLRTDVLTLHTHPLPEGTVDEFLLRTPAEVSAGDLADAVGGAGGRDVWMERADAHDLVDPPTRMLHLATRTALDAAEVPLALRRILGRCTIRSLPPGRGHVITADVLDGTVMCLHDTSGGGSITVSRPYLPFTPSEFARARALVELDARLGPRLPGARHVALLPTGGGITIRRAGPEDAGRAVGLHERCSPETLRRRYHGPAPDADRYLNHLLSPRYGQALAGESADGDLVALAHLLWDGDETEVALLVEDSWQRRGIGLELLRRLVTMAQAAGCASVYAITRADNTAMVASMRRLGLPLDYQIEDGTLVITARLAAPAEDLSDSRAGGA